MIPAVSTAAASAATPKLDYRWATVFDSGVMYTSDSTTASSWTSRTSSFSTTNINGIAANGSTYWVAVGAAGKLATSPDAITWTQRTSSFSTTEIFAVAYGNGIWVAVGAGGKIATATDPTGTWTQRTSGVAVALSSVAYGNGLWVVGGGSGTIITATDPTGTWTSRTSTLSATVSSVCWFPGSSIWMATGDTGTTGSMASSTDGLTWTSRDSASSLTSGGTYLACNNNTGVLASGATVINSTTNGTTWTSRTSAKTYILTKGIATDESNLFVNIGYDGTNSLMVQSSSNGTTWTDRGNTAGFNIPTFIAHSSNVTGAR